MRLFGPLRWELIGLAPVPRCGGGGSYRVDGPAVVGVDR
jgi:hypothetical protein